jgi:hypothetical protein
MLIVYKMFYFRGGYKWLKAKGKEKLFTEVLLLDDLLQKNRLRKNREKAKKKELE